MSSAAGALVESYLYGPFGELLSVRDGAGALLTKSAIGNPIGAFGMWLVSGVGNLLWMGGGVFFNKDTGQTINRGGMKPASASDPEKEDWDARWPGVAKVLGEMTAWEAIQKLLEHQPHVKKLQKMKKIAKEADQLGQAQSDRWLKKMLASPSLLKPYNNFKKNPQNKKAAFVFMGAMALQGSNYGGVNPYARLIFGGIALVYAGILVLEGVQKQTRTEEEGGSIDPIPPFFPPRIDEQKGCKDYPDLAGLPICEDETKLPSSLWKFESNTETSVKEKVLNRLKIRHSDTSLYYTHQTDATSFHLGAKHYYVYSKTQEGYDRKGKMRSVVCQPCCSMLQRDASGKPTKRWKAFYK